MQTPKVPPLEGIEIIEEGRTAITTAIIPITITIIRAAVEFSTMPTVVQWFNAEHAICGATSLGTVQQQMHRSCYADGADPVIMTMPNVQNPEYI